MTQPSTQVVKPILHCFPSLHVSQPSSHEHRWLQLPLSCVVVVTVEAGDVGFAVVDTSVVTVDTDVEVKVVVGGVLSLVVVGSVIIVVVIVFDEVVDENVDEVIVDVAFALKYIN